jgi:hypothetical protein
VCTSGVHGKGLRHVSEGEKKHGDGAHNWGNVKSGEEELEAEIAPVPTAPGEEELGDESTHPVCPACDKPSLTTHHLPLLIFTSCMIGGEAI